MPTFKDFKEQTWKVDFDGLLLADVLTETGVDLGDLSGVGLAELEVNAPKLVKVLVVLLRDEIKAANHTERQFSKCIKGDVFKAAFAAVLGAAADFFPPSVWCDIQQRLETRREISEQLTKVMPMLGPLLDKINLPEMASVRPQVLQALTDMMGGMSLEKLQAFASAGGQVVTPSEPVNATPEKLESAPAA